MTFLPGKSGNPSGKAKHIDPRSADLQVFCRENRDNIKKIGELAIRKALEGEEPWAIKLCMEYFYPKPGTYVAITKEENTEVNVNLTNFSSNLSHEDQQTFLKLWMKSKRGIPAFNHPSESEGEELIEAEAKEV